MLDRTSEQHMHHIRWLLTIGWLLLIFSLFYDPLTSWLTDPDNVISPLHLNPEVCVKVQGSCLVEQPYPIGARLFWAVIVPAGIFILFILGHEFWRRICPLSFLSQIPRALGLQRHRTRVNAKTGKTRQELVKVAKKSWLAKNHLTLQLGLFYLGLCARILFVNSDRLALGLFLIATILSAILVGYLFGGKSWCQYFCPMAPVQRIYSEPRGLLNSSAHVDDRQKITQSMCRTIDQGGKEKPACVACQGPCIDIDAERSYWELITQPDQRWLYYGYFGLVLGFYGYFYLYAGTWDYYFSGVWTHEENQLATLFNPGFYLAGHAIPIPKLVAVPLTLGCFGLGSYWIGDSLEKRLKSYFLKQKRPMSIELIRHKMFTLCTFLVFNVFFMFGARPNLRLFPVPVQHLFTTVIAISSGLWLYRTWPRTPALYQREGLASRLRKQLRKLNLEVGQFLEGRALDDLTADEVYVLAKVLPGFTHDKRLQAYRTILQESLEEGAMTSATSLDLLQNMRRELEITDEDHGNCLAEVGIDDPELLNPDRQQSREDWLRIEGYRLVLAKVFGDRRRAAQGLGADLLAVAGDRKPLTSVQNISLAISDTALSSDEQKTLHQGRQDYGINPEEEHKLMHAFRLGYDNHPLNDA